MSIRTQRIKAGLSVANVADSLGVRTAAVYQWETNVTTPRPQKLVKMAALFGCTIDDLMKEEEDAEVKKDS